MRRDCSLVQLEDMLDRNLFIRISKSGIVNLMNVDSYKKGTINRRRRKDFEIAFQRYDLEFRGE